MYLENSPEMPFFAIGSFSKLGLSQPNLCWLSHVGRCCQDVCKILAQWYIQREHLLYGYMQQNIFFKKDICYLYDIPSLLRVYQLWALINLKKPLKNIHSINVTPYSCQFRKKNLKIVALSLNMKKCIYFVHSVFMQFYVVTISEIWYDSFTATVLVWCCSKIQQQIIIIAAIIAIF